MTFPTAPFADNGLAVDLAAILAFATGHRVAFANEIPIAFEGADWTAFLEIGPSNDGELYGPADVDTGAQFVTAITALAEMPEGAALALGSAVRMRNAACCLVEHDHSSAHGLLVMALETLSRQFGGSPHAWGDLNEAQLWDQFFLDLALSGHQAERFRQRLLGDRQLRLKQTFVQYVGDDLPPCF